MGENTGKHVICEKGKRIVAESSGFVRATHGQKVIRKQFRFRFFPFSFDLSQTINPGSRDWKNVKCFVCLFYRLKETTPFYNTGFWIFLSWWVGTLWALSIQPKLLEISVGTSNGTDHFGLVRPEYSGPALKVVHFDRSGHFGRSVGPKCPFPFDKIVVPSTALLYPAYKRTITTGAVAWVGSMQPECTITLGTWNFRNFKPKFLLNGKRPLLLMKNFPFQK